MKKEDEKIIFRRYNLNDFWHMTATAGGPVFDEHLWPTTQMFINFVIGIRDTRNYNEHNKEVTHVDLPNLKCYKLGMKF